MEEFEQGVTEQEFAETAGQEQSQTQESQVTEQAQQSEVANPTVQDRETNARFAQMRRESEQARQERDLAIAEMYGESHGITTWEQYVQAKAQAETERKAQQMNVDPKFYQEFEGLKQKLSGYETERQQLQHEKTLIEQDKTLSTDPHVGELYTKYKSEVHELAKLSNSDYDIALTLLLRNKLPELLNSTKTSAEQEAVNKLINNSTSSPGSLSQGAESQKSSVYSLSSDDFAKLQEQVLRGERKNL